SASGRSATVFLLMRLDCFFSRILPLTCSFECAVKKRFLAPHCTSRSHCSQAVEYVQKYAHYLLGWSETDDYLSRSKSLKVLVSRSEPQTIQVVDSGWGNGYEPGGRRFESCRAHHRISGLRRTRLSRKGLVVTNSLARMTF